MMEAQVKKITASDLQPKMFDLKAGWKNWAVAVGLILVFVWSAHDTNISLTELVKGLPFMADIISRSFPPDFSDLDRFLLSMLQTIQISIIGTFLAVIIAAPLGLGAARNISPHPVIYQACRLLLNAIRAVSEMIVALIFVAAVGLGPFPGVMALGIHSAGMLGKFYAEAIENVSLGEIEALEAAGANKWQILRYAIWPQILPEFISVNLYRWELNVRAATVLGLVGAGGIGFDLVTTLRLFRYQETVTIIMLILVTVIILDKICTKLRTKIL